MGAYVDSGWPILKHLGVMLGSSWLQLGSRGAILALSWAISSSLGAHLGSSWALLGTTNHAKTVGKTMFCDMMLKIDKVDACFTILHPCCGHVGLSEAPSWAMLNEVGTLLGSICGQVVPSWARVGPSWLPFGLLLSLCWALVGPSHAKASHSWSTWCFKGASWRPSRWIFKAATR